MSQLIEVKVVEKVGRKGHIKVQHLGGETLGLEGYVKTRQIIIPWGEEWRKRPPSARAIRHSWLTDLIVNAAVAVQEGRRKRK